MFDYNNLDNLINEALESQKIILDEKIVSKKAMRRLKKQKAQRQKASQNQQKTNTEKTQKSSKNTQLIVYKEPTYQQKDFSEDFKELLSKLNEMAIIHSKNVDKANQLWKSAGEDKPCPQEAWDLMNTSLKTLKDNIDKTINSYLTQDNTFTPPELQFIDKFTQGVNGYIEKMTKHVAAVKPNLTQDELKSLDKKSTATDLVPTTGTSVTRTKSTALTKVKQGLNALVSKKKSEFVDYKEFTKLTKNLDISYKDLIKSSQNVEKMNWKQFAVNLSDLGKWFNPKNYIILTSPLVRDVIKTFMYANPITAMIYDGDILNIKLTSLDNIKKWYSHKIEKWRQQTQDKENLTDRGLPKQIDSNLTLQEYVNMLYGNRIWCGLINVAYNHDDVKIKDKAQLQELVNKVKAGISSKNIKFIVTNLQNLLNLCNDICNYMNWKKPKQWMETAEGMGNTQKTLDKIDKLTKKTKQKNKYNNSPSKLIANDFKVLKKGNPSRQDLIKTLTSDGYGHKESDVIAYLDKIGYQESYNVTNKLLQLLEQAEA